MKKKQKSQHAYEKDLFMNATVASSTECTGRNAVEPVNRAMADGFEDIYDTSPLLKPHSDNKNNGAAH